ncbi:MAG: Rieske (2Fe-2S) protein [Bacteroidales bacterium]|nr:Rieske (2Fe-2S) protein [Bacteroidales bacterium]
MNRRFFFKTLASVIGLFFTGLWFKMVHVQNKNLVAKTVVISLDSLSEINFFNDFIVVREGSNLSVLSSKCTHLGCRIGHVSQDLLQCPCHGSSFDRAGQVVTGPALRPLPNLRYDIDQKNNTLTVFLA